MSTIAIITARGGSKRIPRKNIKPFMGKPMLAYAIEAAKGAEVFDEIMVSTDDDEIASIARANGASVPFMRSERTANDHATTVEVLEEVLSRYASSGQKFDTTCCLYPCVPFLKPSVLRSAFNLLADYDAVVPVCHYPVPIEWAMRIQDGCLIPNDPKSQSLRSQDLEPKYYDVGMFYYCRTSVLLQGKSLVPRRTAAFKIDEMSCQDIDTPDDWKMAEVKWRMMNV